MNVNKIVIDGMDFVVKIHIEKRNNCRVSIRKHVINIRIDQRLSVHDHQ